MGKRKLSGGEAVPAKEVEAKEEEKEEPQDPCKPGPIDLNPLKFLISPKETSEFTSEYWEKAPLYVAADEGRKKFFDGLFDFEELAKVADQLEAGSLIVMDQDPGPKGDSLTFDDDVNDEMIRTIGPLMFGRDVVAARYIDGKRETIAGDFADSDSLRTLYTKAGATLQLHQPQRFVNGLWRLVAALEAQAGCLVGCNAYVTPKDGQGLAPHHDDVELFVCQTQGSKKWRLYKPPNGFELPSKASGDLPQDQLGDPILEVTMRPGDVLYIPRGVVHQAVAQEEGSCHLTISTYQRWTWGDLAEAVMETAREAQGEAKCALPLELRRGLPLGFIYRHGVQVELLAKDAAATARPDAASLAAGLRALADQLEAGPLELLTPAVDNFALDFLCNRIPPHPCQLPEEGEEPEIDDSLACRGKNLFRLVEVEGGMSDDEDEDEDEDGEGEGEEKKEKVKEEKPEGDKKEAYVKLVTCLTNSRFKHMMSTVEPEEEEEEDEEDDGHHHHDHEGPCGMECMMGSGSEKDEEEEVEEEEEEEKAEEGKAGKVEKAGEEEEKKGKKGGKGKKGKDEEEKEEEEEEKGSKGKKKGSKGKEEEKVEDVDAAEMDVSGEGDDDDSEEDGSEGDEEEEDEDDEDEEPELQGPIFPIQYAVVLADVLASSLEHPLPVKSLRVPGADPQEQLRLARLLHEFGFVVTVPAGAKKEEVKEEVKEEKVVKKEVKKEAKEEAAKGASPAAKSASPAAKKAKKGGK